MPAADDLLATSGTEAGHPGQRPGFHRGLHRGFHPGFHPGPHSAQRRGISAAKSADKNDEGGEQGDAWLVWMSELLKSTRGLALVSIRESGDASITAQQPAAVTFPEAGLALARRVAERRSRQRLILPGTGEVLLALPLPTHSDEERISSVLLLFNAALSQQQQGSLLGLANWAVKSVLWWNERTVSTGALFTADGDAMSEPLNITQLIDVLGGYYPGTVCALHWMQTDRRGIRKSRVMAVSGQSTIDRSGAAVRRIAQSVEALYREGTPVTQRNGRSTAVNDSAAPRQATKRGDSMPETGCLMVPVHAAGELLVVSMHALEEASLTDAEYDALLSSLVPAVQSAWLKELCSQGVLQLLRRRWHARLKALLQGGTKRAVQLGGVALVLLLLLWPVDKRLSAQVIVEAAERHALIAPLDGYVKSVQARAGDRVAKGDLLASLDDEDLLRQADKWTAEAQKNQQDHLSALAAHDRVELSSLRENRVLIQAELDQVNAQLARHELRAPVAGIVLRDSVEDALGSAVEAGKVLFEVGSAEQYRLALQVPERRISEVEPGQLLSLRMAADPKQRSQARVETLIPVATASQGQNTFKVYASPLVRDAGLRPGMKGIGKILVGRESRLLQWWNSLWARCVWLAWKIGLVA